MSELDRTRTQWLGRQIELHRLVIHSLVKPGNQQLAVRSFFGPDNWASAFVRPEDYILRCPDERIKDTIRAPLGIFGSGHGLGEIDWRCITMMMRMAGINLTHRLEVSYHADCAKCGGIDEVAFNAALQAQDFLGCRNDVISSGFDRQKASIPMYGDPGFHHAMAVVLDFSGVFNARLLRKVLKVFPYAFHVTALFAPSEQMMAEWIHLLATIIYGDHGMGREIINENGVIAFVFGNPANPNFSIKEVMPVINAPLNQAFGDDLRLVALDAPNGL